MNLSSLGKLHDAELSAASCVEILLAILFCSEQEYSFNMPCDFLLDKTLQPVYIIISPVMFFKETFFLS